MHDLDTYINFTVLVEIFNFFGKLDFVILVRKLNFANLEEKLVFTVLAKTHLAGLWFWREKSIFQIWQKTRFYSFGKILAKNSILLF